MALPLLLLLAFSLTLLLFYYLTAALLSPLRSIPGPFWARFTRWWKFIEIYRGEFEKTNIELHRRYGPVVRISPNEYSIDDPEATKEIYGLGSHFVKSPWYIASGNPDPHATADLFTDLDPKRHAVNRRKVASLYSMTNLVQMEPFVNDCTGILVKRFTEFAQRGEGVDMGHWLQCYAFDVIGHVTLADRFGFLNSGEDISGIMSAIDDYLTYLSLVGVFSEWHTQIATFLSRFTKDDTGVSAISKFTQTQLTKRTSSFPPSKPSSSKQGGDFLTKLLQMHESDPEKVDMKDVFTTCMTNIGAGSDTTSISLGSVIYHLCKYPDTMRALRKEIDTMENEGSISKPVTFGETQKMPYLQAVLKEALRVHPATGLPLGRVVPKGGKVIAGYVFPEGSIVGINSWVAHANTDVFGQDAHVFRPERWLESKEKSAVLDKYFFSFGMGSRTCIGKNISLLEMAKLIPQLVRNFDIELEQPDREWRTTNKWFVKQEGFFCRVRVRV
ncbi:cytochrome P450 oxidoreductase [Leptodontidium sp. MPI-SDFR-AT-0119]|nr:cytochrome P450 oxidoreductase [Leptodontidium sp. MPI-SDFR-AT-0119]